MKTDNFFKLTISKNLIKSKLICRKEDYDECGIFCKQIHNCKIGLNSGGIGAMKI